MKDSQKKKNKNKNASAFKKLIYLLLVVFSLLTLLVYFDVEIKRGSLYFKTQDLKSNFKPVSYPILREVSSPDLSALAAIIIEDDSKKIIYSKNSSLRLLPASTTKVMTALTALEFYKAENILTVNAPFYEGSVLGLKVGEKIKFESLLYALLLPSANDAAEVIAQHYPGGREQFINKMNENAAKLHMRNTFFSDPSGISDKNYTTAYDLSLLSSIAFKNKLIKRIVGTQEKIVTDENGKQYELSNLNKLLGSNGVEGIKTGFTEEAGQVLITAQIKNILGQEKTFIIVVMRSDDRFGDTEKLLNYLKDNIDLLIIHP